MHIPNPGVSVNHWYDKDTFIHMISNDQCDKIGFSKMSWFKTADGYLIKTDAKRQQLCLVRANRIQHIFFRIGYAFGKYQDVSSKAVRVCLGITEKKHIRGWMTTERWNAVKTQGPQTGDHQDRAQKRQILKTTDSDTENAALQRKEEPPTQENNQTPDSEKKELTTEKNLSNLLSDSETEREKLITYQKFGAFNALVLDVFKYLFSTFLNKKDLDNCTTLNHSFQLFCRQIHSHAIPNYLIRSTDPSIIQLNDEKKIQLALQIENNLLSKKLKPVLTRTYPSQVTSKQVQEEETYNITYFLQYRYGTFPLPQALIGPFFVALHPQSENNLVLYNINTAKSISWDVSQQEDRVIALMPIPVPNKSLLLSSSYVKNDCALYQVWDLDKIQSNTPVPLAKWSFPIMYTHLSQSHLFVGSNMLSPTTAASKDGIIAISTTTDVFLYHMQWQTPIFLPFKQAIQIEFSPSYLILVSHTSIVIVEKEKIANALTTKSKVELVLVYECSKQKTIRLAKRRGDLLAIAYDTVQEDTENATYVIGEVINWREKKQLYQLGYSLKKEVKKANLAIRSMEFQGNSLFTASSVLTRWDLSPPVNTSSVLLAAQCHIAPSQIDDSQHLSYIIGSSILGTEHGKMFMLSTKDRSLHWLEKQQYLDPKEETTSQATEQYMKSIDTFELNGKYLVVGETKIVMKKKDEGYTITSARNLSDHISKTFARTLSLYKFAD